MALPQIISRNQIQKIPSVAINVRKVLSGGTDGDFYTCPAGKRARIKGYVICTGLGAAATVNFEVAGTVLYTWDGTALTGDYLENPRTLTALQGGQGALFDVQIEAGDILQYTQNTGTNAEMNMNAEVLETPV